MADTLAELLTRACRRHRHRVAVVARGDQRTYGQLLENGARLANALRDRGLRPGDPVAALLEDTAAALEVWVGCTLGGFPVVHVNDRLVASEVAYVLEDSGARALVHTDGRSAVVAEVDGREDLAAVVTLGDDRPPGALGYDDLLAAAPTTLPDHGRGPDDLAIVGYTSGTTGFPKGAMIPHRAVVACVLLVPFAYRLPLHSRCAFTGTLSFVSGIWGVILPHLYLGGTLHFLFPYTVESWVDHLVRERSTFTYAPAPLVPGFVAEVERRPEALEHLEAILHSASPLPPDHMEALVGVAGERVVEVWGMTESAGPLTVTPREHWRGLGGAERPFATVGRALPNAGIRVVGDGGADLPPGETGELVVEAETLFTGYLGRPEQTAEVLTDGWYRTGDLGHLDEAGYVYVTDRAKDLIISGGMNVYPAEVEAALASLAGVAEVAVLGLPDERWGEAVVAAVVRAPDAELGEDEVVAHARAHLAGYKKPTRVAFVDELPRNAGLKVQKHLLRQQLTGEAAS